MQHKGCLLAVVLAAVFVSTLPAEAAPAAEPAPQLQAVQTGSEQTPFTVKLQQSPKSPTEIAQDRADRQERTNTDGLMAALTGALVIVGLIQTLVFTVQSILLRQTIKETRRIGEAQTRAFVSLKSAAIYLAGLDGLLFVNIVARNSGQSPARTFVWRPQLRLYADLEQGVGNALDKDWLNSPGADLAAGGESEPHDLMFIVHDLMIGKYQEKCETDPDKIAVSLCVDFSYVDVFGKRHTEAAYFLGVAEKGDAEENKRSIFPGNTSAWKCFLQPVGRTENWDEPVSTLEFLEADGATASRG